MYKTLCLLAFVFIINLRAQPVTPSESPEKEAKPAASPDYKKAAKSLSVNVSERFRATIAPEKLQPVNVPRLENAPLIDGRLDDAAWKQAAVFKDFYQTAPGDNIAPSKPTVAYLAYDSENLYLAFYCYDEPDKIRATVAKRDAVFGEDNVRVFLDTFDDGRRAYVLGFNPLGIQQDGIYTEGQGADYSVDVVMESKGIIVSDGWTLEAKIPFKSLRYAAGHGKTWGIHLWRNIDRFNDEMDSWMPLDRNVSSTLAQEGKIANLENIKVERALELVPSVTISETGRRYATYPVAGGRFVNEKIKNEIGLNLKFNFTPNVTLDAAFNPDFAEVEADAVINTANQRFPIFFQEKRPFFLEGADIFQTPLQPFYSRTIIAPTAATKLTGKVGKNSFGFLLAQDKAPGDYAEDDLLTPTQQARAAEFLGRKASFAVLRLKRDVGRENNFGFFAAARTFPEQRNVVAGVDGKIRWSERFVSQFQILGTHSRRCFFENEFEPLLNPAQAAQNKAICQTGQNPANASPYFRYRNGNGAGYSFTADYTEKNRGWYFETNGRTQFYRTDAGFTRRTNTNRIFLAGRLSTEPNPSGKIIRVNFRPISSISYNFKGRTQNLNAGANLNFSFQHNTSAWIETGIDYERLFEGEFGLSRRLSRPSSGAFFGASAERSTISQHISGGLASTLNKRISISGFAGFLNNAFDYDYGGGARFPRVSPAALAGASQFDPGAGRQFDFQFEADFRPTDPWRISLNYKKSRLTRTDTRRTAFDSNIYSLRSTYQFTRFTFVRTRFDFDSIRSRGAGQILFGWNPNPGTAFYVGYNDDFNYNGFNPYTGDLEPRFARNNRRFFIRASYLFRRSF
jgi:hypothetical protein